MNENKEKFEKVSKRVKLLEEDFEPEININYSKFSMTEEFVHKNRTEEEKE